MADDQIPGPALRDARKRRGFRSLEAAAEYAQVSPRTWGDWERHGVYWKEVARIRTLFFSEDEAASGLGEYSDMELLAEVARRLARRGDPTPRGGISPTRGGEGNDSPESEVGPDGPPTLDEPPTRHVGRRPPRRKL